jgi:polyhydroxyalkanoate synthesis regulator protein
MSGLMDMPDLAGDSANSILIKRYANRRLYNTASLTYVSLEDLAEWVLAQRRFTVREAATGEDITALILSRLH